MSEEAKYTSLQEEFWAGEFGVAYIDRNASEQLLKSNGNFFFKALNLAESISSCLELGANIGMNLKALKQLYPQLQINAVEINPVAAKALVDLIGKENVFEGSIFEYQIDKQFDLVLTKTVLIHINPELLSIAYEKLYQASNRYELICEYYNPTPVTVTYRGNSDRLFKRDFAGDMLDRYKDLEIIDYGFVYHRDSKFPQDDINWFLLEKR